MNDPQRSKFQMSMLGLSPYTLQGTYISHLGKRKIIFKSALVGDMLVPRYVQ